MKVLSSLFLSALVVSTAAQSFDYNAPATGSGKCALINVVMDESGSMGGEQAFMKSTALPRMATTLYNEKGYKHVFVCSTGFTNYSSGARSNFIGCTEYDTNGDLVDTTVLAWTLTGGFEDGWHAMMTAIDSVPAAINTVDLLSACGSVDKNLILVTDEDRDIYSADTATSVKNYIDTKGYVLNAIVNVGIDSTNNNVGMKISNGGLDGTIYAVDGSAPEGYSSTTRNNENYTGYVTKFGTTHADYSVLIVDTNGAIWNVNSLRYGGAPAIAFADAFIDVKVEEISSGTGGPSGGGGGGRPEVSGTQTTEIVGDPHMITWKKEHYEYHGQCDLVMVKDDQFADGLGLEIHIRTKIVRYWSYIKTVAIKIGNDILEIEGSTDASDDQAHYWVNFEYQGELESFAGFPVSQKLPSPYKRSYKIDLSPKFPGQDITIQLYKEFARVKLNGGEEAFGSTVGLMGNYFTGKTLARDGTTVMNDFTEFGDEWQVLPSEPRLFHEISKPQFPELCIKPEDPRGDRKRRLAESRISIEQAEAACATLEDPLTIKDCVYDILATQDMDMVGAF